MTSNKLVKAASGAVLANDEETVARLDTEYQSAVARNDASTVERLLADDFVLVTGTGRLLSKTDILEEIQSGRFVYEHQEDSQRVVRVWGDTAVVTALLWAKGNEDGKPFEYQIWFSDTYARLGGRWRYVFAQCGTRQSKAL